MTRLPISSKPIIDLTTSTNAYVSINTAEQACHLLQSPLKCSVCSNGYTTMRPWRSIACDHSFCCSCAQKVKQISPSKCPINSCDVPLRPSDLIEDVGISAVLDACHDLSLWAHNSQKTT